MKQRALRAHQSLNLLSELQSDKRSPKKAPLAYDDDEEQTALCLEEDEAILFDIDDVSEMLKVKNGIELLQLFLTLSYLSVIGISIFYFCMTLDA